MNTNRINVSSIPDNVSPDVLMALCDSDPSVLSQLSIMDPELAAALQTRDVAQVRLKLMSRYMRLFKTNLVKQQEIAAIEANPDSEENQRKIAEAIQRENIEMNRELAYENIPEALIQVQMLYVKIEVNNSFVNAFVDSGAQATIMSVACAERCNLMRLVDTRYEGMAKGVGTAKIIGRVHMCQMKFGNTFLPLSLTILENNDVDFLLGLDMLRRYRATLDLGHNSLKIENEELPFITPEQSKSEAASSGSNV